MATAQIKRRLIAAAREVILVCDAGKFGTIAPVNVAPLDIVHRVITDQRIPAPYRTYFEERRITVEHV